MRYRPVRRCLRTFLPDNEARVHEVKSRRTEIISVPVIALFYMKFIISNATEFPSLDLKPCPFPQRSCGWRCVKLEILGLKDASCKYITTEGSFRSAQFFLKCRTQRQCIHNP